MTSTLFRPLLIGTAMLALGACNKTATNGENGAVAGNEAAATNASAPTSNDPVASAESAAPASIAHDASIVTMDDKASQGQQRLDLPS